MTRNIRIRHNKYASIDTHSLQCAMTDLLSRVAPVHQYNVLDVAPEAYRDLCSAMSSSPTMPILGLFSDNTVWGEASSNHLARMWHDATHLLLNKDFSVDEEHIVAIEQARVVSHWSAMLADVVYADLRGQTLHMIKYGCFPDHQVNFVVNYLKTGAIKRS